MSDHDPDGAAPRGTDDPDSYREAPDISRDADPVAARWLGDSRPLHATLPDDVQAALGRLLGRDPVETLVDWVGLVRRFTGGGAIAVNDLCHVPGPSPHRGTVEGETYHFACFYDAVILAALVDGAVEVRTESPDGAVVEAVATPDELRVAPETGVFSFGVARLVSPPQGEPSLGAVYAAVCPYVAAFPDRDAYDRWATAVPAATVATPMSGATALARALVE